MLLRCVTGALALLGYIFAMASRSSYIPCVVAVSSAAMESPDVETASASVQPAVQADIASVAHFLLFMEIAPGKNNVFANPLLLQ